MSACADCGAPAALGVTEGGVSRSLCAACAEQRAGIALGGLARALRRPRRRDGICPHCGTTADQAIQTAIVGCPLCYEAFREALDRAGALEPTDSNADLW